MQNISINDLMQSLKSAKQLNNLTQKLLIDQPQNIKKLSKKKKQQLKREQSYRVLQQDLDKWIGIVKLNREKESLNFDRKQNNEAQVNFFPNKIISPFHKQLQVQLSKQKLSNAEHILQKQASQMSKIDPQQAKRRLVEARKNRAYVFNQEVKRRRISKIKSKLYRKIKKKQKLRDQALNLQKMSNQEKNRYMEKVTKKRIHERITLRHRSKNKHIENLLRFSKNDKNQIQASINEVNRIRSEQLAMTQRFQENTSNDYDDQNYQKQAVLDLEEEIERIEAEHEQEPPHNWLDQMKFMKMARQKANERDKAEAEKLLSKLNDGEDLAISDIEQSEQHKERNRKQFSKLPVDNVQQDKVKPLKSASQAQHYGNVSRYLRDEDPNCLIENINLAKLKERYNTNPIELDASKMIKEHKGLWKDLGKQIIAENRADFEREKVATFQKEIVSESSKKGWGNWAGPGIKEKKVDSQAQIREKLAKIEAIKQKRRDGLLANIKLENHRNKELEQYMVKRLPHDYKSAEQFDYLQREALGAEWNTLMQFQDNIKPKIRNSKGKVIEPIRMPKSKH